jgi:hypothetical protein
MNPYLEHPLAFHDFHETYIPALREALAARLRPRYSVRIDEHVYIHELSAEERRLHGRPDVGIAANPPWGRVPSSGSGVTTLDAPVRVEHPVAIDELRECYLKIVDAKSREVVTVIEMLSPANKAKGSDREQYLAKRKRVLASSTSLVELDFLRAGPRMPDANVPACDYAITVSRWESRPAAGCWPIRLRDPFPAVPIPLKTGDADVTVDLKAILDRVYDAAGYEDEIYTNPLEPPLSPEDAAWAATILAGAGVKS